MDRDVIAAYTRVLDAWNRRSADDFAAQFADNGSSVGFDGSQMNGRAEISASLRAIFENHPTAAYVAKIRELRMLAGGVTLLRAAVGMVPPGKAELNPAVHAIQSVVFVAPDGQPQIALLHNTPAAFHGRPQLIDALTSELDEVRQSGQIVR
jgi:uncharacterized protein (TIGR02246 family)